jgi:hypothetical protein
VKPIEPQCPKCGHTFASERDLQEHIKTCKGGTGKTAEFMSRPMTATLGRSRLINCSFFSFTFEKGGIHENPIHLLYPACGRKYHLYQLVLRLNQWINRSPKRPLQVVWPK